MEEVVDHVVDIALREKPVFLSPHESAPIILKAVFVGQGEFLIELEIQYRRNAVAATRAAKEVALILEELSVARR